MGAVTSIRKVHEAPAPSVAPESVTLPAVEVTVPPAHVVDAFGVAARTSPVPGVAGNVSVSESAVTAAVFGLVTVMVSVVTSPELMLAGAKALPKVSGVAVTVRLALLDAAPVAASLEDTPLAWLGQVPAIALVTTIVTVQVALAGIVRPVKLRSPVCPFA